MVNVIEVLLLAIRPDFLFGRFFCGSKFREKVCGMVELEQENAGGKLNYLSDNHHSF